MSHCALCDSSLHDCVLGLPMLHGVYRDDLLPQPVHNPRCAQQSAFKVHASLILCRWPITLPRVCPE